MKMAAGNVREGLEELDRIRRIKEEQSNYLENAAADFLRLTDQGRNLDGCLAVSFSWDENHRFTDSIRNGLKEGCVLPAEGTCLKVHESLRWTNQQKRDWQRYERGQVVTFAPASNRPASSAIVVRVEKTKVVVALSSRKEMTLDFVSRLIRSMSLVRGKSKLLWVTRYSFAPITSGLASPMDRY